MAPVYMLAAALALFAIGLSGIVASRHFVVMILSSEVILVSAIIAAAAFFSSATAGDGSFIVLVLTIWAIAGAEIIVLVSFYTRMKSMNVDFDVSKLNKLRG